MTEKELKKLNRYQLLELIILQTEQITDLEKQLEDTRQLLNNQQIQVSQVGSIAEAALQLSGIFEAAQTAADTYLANITEHVKKADEIEAAAQNAAQQLESDARVKAEQIESEARQAADRLVSEAQEKSREIVNLAAAEADSILKKARSQADTDIRSAQAMLKETTRRCTEKENAVNTYITNIREAFQLQFQNLDQITKA